MKRIFYTCILCVIILIFTFGCSSSSNTNSSDTDDDDEGNTAITLLEDATTWMYQIQDLDADGAIEAIAATDYPMLVLEPTYTIAGDEGFDVEGMISALRTAPDGTARLLIAYIDIGQAEDYRTYWGDDWIAPTETESGTPDFLVTTDPDGWSGNYPVAYWDLRWQDLWLGDDGIIAQLATYGFDGVYLDWIEAYDDEKVIEEADAAGKNSPNEMVSFISRLRDAGRSVTPDFLVIAQNAPYLLDEATDDYASAIDALAMEDTWFGGESDANWDDADAGDIVNSNAGDFSTAELLAQYNKYLAINKPVFTVDYCISKSNAAQVYTDSRANGLIPLITRVSLSKLTEIPPPSE